MTSKRGLQAEVEFYKEQFRRSGEEGRRRVENAEVQRQQAWDSVSDLLAFLDALLVLEPSLERFRVDQGGGWGSKWDFDGAKHAAEFNTSKDLAEQYQAEAKVERAK